MKYPETLLRSKRLSIFGNALYHNMGDGRYEEVSDKVNAENYWPWGFTVADLTADGYELDRRPQSTTACSRQTSPTRERITSPPLGMVTTVCTAPAPSP